MADSYAYFQVAHKVHILLNLSLISYIVDNHPFTQRIIDYVPLTIEHELNQTFVKNLQPLLFSNIAQEATTPGRLEELVQEDSALEKRRRRLEKRRTDLLKIKEKLDAFWSLPNNVRNHSQAPRFNAKRSSSVSTDDDNHSIIASMD